MDVRDDHRAGPRVTIGEVCERTGLSVHALRFYEREGLLADPVERTAAGRRVYAERDVEWIRNCVRFRASGMPVATIRRFAQLVRDGPGNEDQRLDLLREHQQVVADRIAELTGCLELITQGRDVRGQPAPGDGDRTVAGACPRVSRAG